MVTGNCGTAKQMQQRKTSAGTMVVPLMTLFTQQWQKNRYGGFKWYKLKDNFLLFSIKIYIVGIHNVCFYGELKKIIPELSSNTHSSEFN